jgi:hypothetical protein
MTKRCWAMTYCAEWLIVTYRMYKHRVLYLRASGKGHTNTWSQQFRYWYMATGSTRKGKQASNVVVDKMTSGQLLTVYERCWNDPPIQPMHNWALLFQEFLTRWNTSGMFIIIIIISATSSRACHSLSRIYIPVLSLNEIRWVLSDMKHADGQINFTIVEIMDKMGKTK